jgi:hypothetical protein
VSHRERNRRDIPAPRRLASGNQETDVLLHIVLFRPRAGLGAADRESLVAAIERAYREIAVITRFRVGRRTALEASYAGPMPDYPFAALVELQDERALAEYLSDPAHQELARTFWQTSDSALAYDYRLLEAGEVRSLA